MRKCLERNSNRFTNDELGWRCGAELCVTTREAFPQESKSWPISTLAFRNHRTTLFFFVFSLLGIIHFYAFCLFSLSLYIRFFCNFLSFFLAHTDFLLFTLHFNFVSHFFGALLHFFLLFFRCCCEFCVSLVLFLPRLLLLSGAVYRLSCVWTFVACWLAKKPPHVHTQIEAIHTLFRGRGEGKSQHGF